MMIYNDIFNIFLDHLKAFFSSDGRYIITPQNLENELLNYVEERGGRVNIHSLPTIFNVDKAHVDNILQKYTYTNQLDFIFIQDEFISKTYLNNITEEINDLLQERGAITVSFLSQRYSLPHFYMLNLITKNMDKRVHGFFNGEHIYTSLFKESIRSILKGTLNAITIPTPSQDILSNVQSFIDISFSKKQLLELCQEGEVKGKLDIKKNGIEVYIPDIYSSARHQWIEDIFLKNGFISYNVLSELEIPNPLSYMQSHFPDGTGMENMFVSKKFIEDKVRNIEYELENYGGISMIKALELNPETQDYKVLFKEICKSIESKHVIINESILVSSNLIKRILMLIDQHVEHECSMKQSNFQNFEENDYTTLIKSWIPSLKDEEIYDRINEYVIPRFKEAIEKYSNFIFVEESKKSKTLRSFQEDFTPLYHNILYFNESIEDINDNDIQLNLDQYIKSTLCQDLLNFCVKKLSLLYFIDQDNNQESIINKLPSNISKIVINMKRCLSKTDNSFFQYVELLMKECNIEIEGLTDKIRKIIYKTHLKSTQLLLNKTKDMTKRYQLEISLLYSRITNRFIFISTKHLQMIINYIKERVNENDGKILSDSYEILLSYIKAKKEGNINNIEEKVKDLDNSLKLIKSINKT